MASLQQYLNDQKNLPDWMKDFHDQKDIQLKKCLIYEK